MTSKALPVFFFFIALIAITSAADAQSQRKVTVQAAVPYDFVIGNRTLPAGTYVFEMATGSPKTTDQAGVLIVHNYERRLYVAVATGVQSDSNTHLQPKLEFIRNGDRVYLSKVWRQGEIAGLTVPMPSDREEFEESEVLTLDANTSGGI
jgi:hypothetical protein